PAPPHQTSSSGQTARHATLPPRPTPIIERTARQAATARRLLAHHACLWPRRDRWAARQMGPDPGPSNPSGEELAGSCDKAPATGKDGTVSWTLLIPVKRLEIAKTRLRGILSDSEHDRLVLAMAMDVTAAALASPVAGRVIVVTADSLVAKEATGLRSEEHTSEL